MLGRKAKRIRRHVGVLCVEWLHSLLNEEDRADVSPKNYLQFMPKQTHYFAAGELRLNSYHPKWIKKRLFRVLKNAPSKAIEDVTLDEIKTAKDIF